MVKRGSATVPKHLGRAGRELWRRVLEEFEITDAAGLALLQSACEARGRIEDARQAIDEHGVVVKDRFGELRPNPATAVETQARSAMVRALNALRLTPGDAA